MKTVNACDLGIEVTDVGGVFRWLMASFLMGKRIRSTVALRAYRILVDQQGLDTPQKLAQATHATLVRLLGQAGYARYDESTARRLHALGKKVDAELGVQLEALRDDPGCENFKRWLLSFEGIGPKTVEIFMREALGYLSVSEGH
ncbi:MULTISPECIES: DNA methylase [Pseudomonas]|uniref:DNA methylase n=1 Tax=Pseudomonas putida TaxID=303 RepID=A0A1X0ZQM0_PSEPU|nr:MULTISPECIES: DNA methylase [Pseudomonas]PNB53680.1 DNA methylase [Pseudomonas sp. FW305-130]PTC01641.1 DNA methylase [Thalassospira xiamenensis]EKT4560296.1 DNA methylase [Pseudomonas putida]KWW19528.1 DNA methylase [Pseudomonas putida]KYC17335.1 DNA methylase [Pseudomonas sp. ABFPK]